MKSTNLPKRLNFYFHIHPIVQLLILHNLRIIKDYMSLSLIRQIKMNKSNEIPVEIGIPILAKKCLMYSWCSRYHVY